jgi:hypothetical protein
MGESVAQVFALTLGIARYVVQLRSYKSNYSVANLHNIIELTSNFPEKNINSALFGT